MVHKQNPLSRDARAFGNAFDLFDYLGQLALQHAADGAHLSQMLFLMPRPGEELSVVVNCFPSLLTVLLPHLTRRAATLDNLNRCQYHMVLPPVLGRWPRLRARCHGMN